jgi:hypothetical protein
MFILILLALFIRELFLVWFILSIAVCVAGIVLSIIGLAVRKTKFNGSGLCDAIVGIVISTIILVCLFIIVEPEDLRRYNGNSRYDDYYEEDDYYDDDYDYDDYYDEDEDDDDYSYSSKKDVIVKDFSSMTKEEIKNWCKNNNITCSILEVYSDTIEKGKFVEQSVKPNETIKEEGLIRINFSKGKRAELTKEELVKKAESYSKNFNMSKKKLYNQLTSEYGEAFTEEEANYAIEHADIDWKRNALEQAKIYKKKKMLNYDIYTKLSSESGDQFTEEEAQYAINHLEY